MKQPSDLKRMLRLIAPFLPKPAPLPPVPVREWKLWDDLDYSARPSVSGAQGEGEK